MNIMSIIDALRGKSNQSPQNAPLGSGMVKQAANTLDLRKQYNDYNIDKQSNGEQPVSFDDFAKGAR